MDFSIKQKNLDAEESKLGTWNSGVSQERNWVQIKIQMQNSPDHRYEQ